VGIVFEGEPDGQECWRLRVDRFEHRKRRARLEEGGVLKRDKERTCDEGIVSYREENDRRGRHDKEQAKQDGRRGW
jgi:hypothetical protein